MDNTHEKIRDKTIIDSEIIQYIEHVKRKNSKFDIKLGCIEDGRALLMVAVLHNRKKLNPVGPQY